MRFSRNRDKMSKLWFYGFVTLVIGCGRAEPPNPAGPATDPAAAFYTLEDRLLKADTVKFDFHVTAEGALEIDLRGMLDIGPADNIRLTASGEFAGRPVDLLLLSEGEEMELGDKTNRATATRPAHLKEALVIGLTRMGILHNLARLMEASAPDHAEGGVGEWVTVDSFAASAEGSHALSFDLTVAGERSGSASLEIDAEGRPTVRNQTVQFPSGEMRVVEMYSVVKIQP